MPGLQNPSILRMLPKQYINHGRCVLKPIVLSHDKHKDLYAS